MLPPLHDVFVVTDQASATDTTAEEQNRLKFQVSVFSMGRSLGGPALLNRMPCPKNRKE